MGARRFFFLRRRVRNINPATGEVIGQTTMLLPGRGGPPGLRRDRMVHRPQVRRHCLRQLHEAIVAEQALLVPSWWPRLRTPATVTDLAQLDAPLEEGLLLAGRRQLRLGAAPGRQQRCCRPGAAPRRSCRSPPPARAVPPRGVRPAGQMGDHHRGADLGHQLGTEELPVRSHDWPRAAGEGSAGGTCGRWTIRSRRRPGGPPRWPGPCPPRWRRWSGPMDLFGGRVDVVEPGAGRRTRSSAPSISIRRSLPSSVCVSEAAVVVMTLPWRGWSGSPWSRRGVRWWPQAAERMDGRSLPRAEILPCTCRE